MAFGFIKRGIRLLGQPFFKLRRTAPPDIETIYVTIPDLPPAFRGYRMAVVSDLHLPDCLSSPAQVLDALQDIRPDCILVAGDVTNRYNRFDEDGALEFLQKISQIAPAFAISGNHEENDDRAEAYYQVVKNTGTVLLQNRTVKLEHRGDFLFLCGVCDRKARPHARKEHPTVLLMHNPADAVRCADCGFCLAVCGHAHGGQMRLGRRGLFAPGQGFFAKYVSGWYRIGDMQMVVSRGLGDSSLPIRVHNLPHLPVIVLQSR